MSLNELADQVAHLVMDNLARRPGFTRMDAHHFAGLSRAVNSVIVHHVGTCLLGMASVPYDAWARTGGTRETQPLCPDHERRAREEKAQEFQQLFAELETEIIRFLSRGKPERAAFNHKFAESLHRTITESVVPYLHQNIAASCCTEGAPD